VRDRERLERALALARAGNVDGALAILEEASEGAPDENLEGFLFMLVRGRDRERAIALATRCIARVEHDLSRSTWLLRRGLLHLEAEDPQAAFADLMAVLQLNVNDSHAEQARLAMARGITVH